MKQTNQDASHSPTCAYVQALAGVHGAEHFVEIAWITKGQSADRKYRILTDGGEKLLVRIGDAVESDRKKAEYTMLSRADAAGIPTQRPLAFGYCADGRTYAVVGWCAGTDTEALLPSLNAQKRYDLGRKAGALLRRLHEMPAPDGVEPWGIRFRRKVQSRIESFDQMQEAPTKGAVMRDYLLAHQALLDARPQTFNHGDYNAGNLIVAPDGTMRVIDFNAYHGGFGDPWWELGENEDEDFLRGQLVGYFPDGVPRDFYPLCAYYAAYGALAALCDAPAEGTAQIDRVCAWFDGLHTDIPTWARHLI